MLIRIISLLGMTGGFLLISPSLRGTVMFGLSRMMLEMAKYSPYSYIVLALAIGCGTVMSLAAPKAQ